MNNLATMTTTFTGNVKKAAIILGLAIVALFGLSAVEDNKASAAADPYISADFNYETIPPYDKSMDIVGGNIYNPIQINASVYQTYYSVLVLVSDFGNTNTKTYALSLERKVNGTWTRVTGVQNVSIHSAKSHLITFSNIAVSNAEMRMVFKVNPGEMTKTLYFTR